MTFSRVSFDSASVELAARSIGETLREAAHGACGSERMGAEAERLRRAVVQTQSVQKSRFSFGFVVAVAASVGALFLGGYAALERGASPLSVEARSGQPVERAVFAHVGSHHLLAPELGLGELRFSDGSRVTVETGARIRVQELYATGAALLLEKGRANVQVVHRDNSTRWSVAAGPFSVAVTGTRFDVAWEPAAERLIVELHEGRVEIKGPKYVSPITLLAGQRFEGLASERSWSVTPLGVSVAPRGLAPTADPPPAVSLPTPALLVETHSEKAPPHKVAASRARGSESAAGVAAEASSLAAVPTAPEGRQWAKLVATGEFRQVTREADTMGLMACLSQCSASDLRALADASRYTGRLDTAEAALRELHDRYPAQASSASYLLGAVDEARGRNATALRWYEEYLSRNSAGGFVAEARAARLRMLVATGGNVAARGAAREYLEQYPHGAAAGLATKVMEGR